MERVAGSIFGSGKITVNQCKFKPRPIQLRFFYTIFVYPRELYLLTSAYTTFMQVKPNLLLTLLLSIVLLAGCKKHDSEPLGENMDIYIAGTVDKKPTYWKNTTLTVLPGGLNAEGFATGIAISGKDVYVSGTVPSGTPYPQSNVGVYWKNGVLNNLGGSADGSATTGIAVLGNDVYVIGFAFNGNTTEACYWKNGVKTVLGTSPVFSRATGIAIIGSDVYISGTGNSLAYWKNGVKVSLSVGALGGTAHDIAVNDLGDIVIGGTETYQAATTTLRSRAVYWKNGALMQITSNDAYSTSIKALTLQGNEVYTVGFDLFTPTNFRALYFKNINLITTTSGVTTAVANDIGVKGTDVYTVGSTGSFSAGTSKAVMWKNGEAVQLSQSFSEANAIALNIY